MNHAVDTDPGETSRAARQEFKREAIEFVKMIVWFLVLFAILRTFVVEGYEVQGDSMAPTLTDHERILVFKLPHNLSKLWPFRGIEALKEGNIVVFDSLNEPDKRYVKRVVARGPKRLPSNKVEAGRFGQDASPGEAITVKFEEGKVFVNDRRVEETYLPSDTPPCGETCPEAWMLPPSSYYVLGDNRPVSKDSRSFGVVDDDHVIGKAVFRFWPLGKFGPL